jgi:hypothetical protein
MFEPLTNIHGRHDDDERKEGQRRQANVRPSRPSPEGFYALIVDSLVQEKFAESLLLTPTVLRY